MQNEVVKSFLAGAIASGAATCCSNPLEVAKVQLQLNPGKNLRMFEELFRLYKHEGLKSWWRGLSPALIRSGTYSAIRLSAYDFFYGSFAQFGYSDTFVQRLCSGAGAGVVAAFIGTIVFLYYATLGPLGKDDLLVTILMCSQSS